jgi:hypothetical protein
MNIPSRPRQASTSGPAAPRGPRAPARTSWRLVANVLAVAALAGACSSPAGVKPIPDDAKASLTATAILDRMAEIYATCRTYRDSGRATLRVPFGDGTSVVHLPFQTVFARPDQFRFASKWAFPGMAWIVWARGSAVRSWDWRDGHQKPESLSSALSEVSGVSGGASRMVPSLLMPGTVAGSSFASLVDAKLLEDDILGDVSCYCVQGRLDSQLVTLWIDQASHLLLRHDREMVLDGQVMEQITTYEPVLDEVIPADALAFAAP